MSKGYSGLFDGTLGTTFNEDSLSEETYGDRGIDIPKDIKTTLSKLKKEGDYTFKHGDAFSMKEVSVMSKETGVEFAKVKVDGKSYLIKGNKTTTKLPKSIVKKIKEGHGELEFHSHPHNNDLIPSRDDRKTLGTLKKLTGQSTSKIVTPNGKVATFGEEGVYNVSTVSNVIDSGSKKIYKKLFGGK